MAGLVKTYKGDLSTAIATRLLSAYFKWEDENYIAQGEPGSNASGTPPSGNVPPSTPPSGGGLPPRSSSALVPVRKVGPTRNVDPRITKLTNLINNPAATAGEKAAARNRLNYITRKGNIPQYERGFIPKPFRTGGIVVREQKLGKFVENAFDDLMVDTTSLVSFFVRLLSLMERKRKKLCLLKKNEKIYFFLIDFKLLNLILSWCVFFRAPYFFKIVPISYNCRNKDRVCSCILYFLIK